MGRAQVSIEYLVITAFAFLFIVPVIAMFYSQSHQINEDITGSQAETVATEIVDAANEVFYLGEPSKKTLLVYLPKNINSITISGKKLVFDVSSRSGNYQIVRTSASNISGTIATFSGIHKIKIEAGTSGVLISE